MTIEYRICAELRGYKETVWGPRQATLSEVKEINETLNNVYADVWIEKRAVSDWEEIL